MKLEVLFVSILLDKVRASFLEFGDAELTFGVVYESQPFPPPPSAHITHVHSTCHVYT